MCVLVPSGPQWQLVNQELTAERIPALQRKRSPPPPAPRPTACDTIHPAPLADPHAARTIISLMPKPVKRLAMTNVLMRHFRRQPCYVSSANAHLLARRWKFSPSSLRTVHLPRASVLFPSPFMWITSRSQVTFCSHLQRRELGCDGGRG